jgi:radical SAM protein with 4Fe4S-binding SPASM domain
MNKNRKDIDERTLLSQVIPLKTPYKINIDVANACNFRCAFCFHALGSARLKKTGFRPGIMDLDLFKMIIHQIGDFPHRIKCIGLAGIGEPLLNKKLPQMVKLVKDNSLTDKVVVTTNGSLLHPELSESLVCAGLDEIIISIEALDSQGYFDVTMTRVDFAKLRNNLAWLYDNRGQCKVYVKIMNTSFVHAQDEAKFHRLFDEISDLAYVEQMIPQFKPIDYDIFNTSFSRTLYGKKVEPIEVCPMIFYAMQISTSGNVCPCCVDYNESVGFGNVRSQRLYDIWNGKVLMEFRKTHLAKKRSKIQLCRDCEYLRYNVRDEDVLDHDAPKIIANIDL